MSNIYKALRTGRIVLSTLCLLVLGAGLSGAGGVVGALAGKVSAAQIVPALLAGAGLWIVFWTVATLLMGRIYCSTACPLGTLQDIAARVMSGKLKGYMTRYRYRSIPMIVRLLALVVFVEAISLGAVGIAHWLDPYADFALLFGVGAGTTAAAVIGGVTVGLTAIISARIGGRTLCNTVCPMGCALGALSSVALLRFDINPDLCIHCGACERTCKGGCINSTVSIVDNSQCVTCFDCTAVCPNGAITWRRGRHRLQWPLLMKKTTKYEAIP